MLPPIHTLEFLGRDLVLMKAEWAAASAAWYLFLVFAIMYIANMTQPQPEWHGR